MAAERRNLKKKFLVSPRVTQLSRLGTPRPNTPGIQGGMCRKIVLPLQSLYIAIYPVVDLPPSGIVKNISI